MAQLKFGAPGVSATEIDLSQPLATQPVGTPAGVVGTALKGPAFVPLTVGVVNDFYKKFGLTDGKKFGPLAAGEWLRNAQALTYLRVLGVGQGTARQGLGGQGISTGGGDVTAGGFTVGENEPVPGDANGDLGPNPYAVAGGPAGRTYFLGCFMSESAGSTAFSSAGVQYPGGPAAPIVRGILMAASGVVMTMSASAVGVSNLIPSSSQVG